MAAVAPAPALVQPCTPADMAEVMATITNAFDESSPFVNMWWPGHRTPAGQAAAAARLEAGILAAKPKTRFFKAVERASGRIVGYAVWSHMRSEADAPGDVTAVVPPAEAAAIWNVGGRDDLPFVRQVFAALNVPRHAAIVKALREQEALPPVEDGAGEEAWTGRGLMYLEMMAVRQDARRQGAGRALMKVGTDIADALKIDSIVEATSVGRFLYASCGFETEIELMDWPVDPELLKVEGRAVPVLTFMRRKYKGT